MRQLDALSAFFSPENVAPAHGETINRTATVRIRASGSGGRDRPRGNVMMANTLKCYPRGQPELSVARRRTSLWEDVPILGKDWEARDVLIAPTAYVAAHRDAKRCGRRPFLRRRLCHPTIARPPRCAEYSCRDGFDAIADDHRNSVPDPGIGIAPAAHRESRRSASA